MFRTSALVVLATVMMPLRCREYIVCPGPDPSGEIVVARRELPPGKTVEVEDLAMMEIERRVVDDRVLTHPEQVVGRVPVERILEGEILREERFADPEAGVGLRALIPEGSGAVEIPLGASLAQPGDYADVLLTRRHPASTERLLEGQRIVATKDAPEPMAVLALPLPEAERVRQALAEGAPTLVMRYPPDVTGQQAHGPMGKPFFGSLPLSER